MTTLADLLEQRKAERPQRICCIEKDYHPVSMVTFCLWQAKEWSLPWSRLDAVTFSHEQESERVELYFSHHQVIVLGENLRRIMDDIRGFKVLCLRDLPATLRAGVRPEAVFITRLEVRLMADPKKSLSDNVPF